MTTPRRKVSRDFDTPKAIPPSMRAITDLQHVLGVLRGIQATDVGIGRVREASEIATLANNIQYRLLVWARLTACTHCDGFRDGSSTESPKTCEHVRSDQ